MVGMTEVMSPISLDGVAVHPDCWCICLCYLHFAPENSEDSKMYFLVPADPSCPGQSPLSWKMVLCVCVWWVRYHVFMIQQLQQWSKEMRRIQHMLTCCRCYHGCSCHLCNNNNNKHMHISMPCIFIWATICSTNFGTLVRASVDLPWGPVSDY